MIKESCLFYKNKPLIVYILTQFLTIVKFIMIEHEKFVETYLGFGGLNIGLYFQK